MNIIQEYYNQQDFFEFGIGKTRKEKLLEILKGEIKGKRILDVGCETGILGGLLKEKDNYVIGVDIAPRSIEMANKVLDKALVLDVENQEFPFPKNYFDTIIISEVIPGMFLPEKLLSKLKELLKEQGSLVITATNFLVFTNRIKMLLGKFEYQTTGLFDRGVIHFFTYNSLKKLLKETGFKIVQENHVIHPRIPQWLQWLARRFPNLFIFQTVVKVKKTRYNEL